MADHVPKESVRNHGSPIAVIRMINRTPAMELPGSLFGGEVLVVPQNRVIPGGRNGPRFKTDEQARGTWILGNLATPNVFRSCRCVAREIESEASYSAFFFFFLSTPVQQDQPRRHPGTAYSQLPREQVRPGRDGLELFYSSVWGFERWLS